MKLFRWRWVVGVALLVFLFIGAYGIYSYIALTANRLRAKATAAYMVRINVYLTTDQPTSVDAASVRALLRRHQAEEYFRDGWGHPFAIETWKDKRNGLNHYRIVALGRSGKKSSCCNTSIGHNWDMNTVMEDGEWVQLWDF
jgi:hypothetical protein